MLRSEQDGTKLTVGDVATVRVEGVDRARTYFVGGNPAISIRVDRSAQGDAIKIQHTVEDVARSFQAALPEHAGDAAREGRESLRDLDLQDRRVDVAGAPPSKGAEKSR